MLFGNSVTKDSDLHLGPSENQEDKPKRERSASSTCIAINVKKARTSFHPLRECNFPFDYSSEDIDIHTRTYSNSQGQHDIDNYTNMSQGDKWNKIELTSKKMQPSSQILTSFQGITLEPRTAVKKCPSCNLSLSSRTEKFIKQHLECCEAEQALFLARIARPKISVHNILNSLW